MKKITIGALIAYAALSQVTDFQSGNIDSFTIDPNAQIDLTDGDSTIIDQGEQVDSSV